MTNFSLEAWPWQPNLCPCDAQFIDWMRDHRHSKHFLGPVFHMGTGEHHRVGRACEAMGVECTGLTASENEDLLKPTLDGYRVILEDIYKLDVMKLPSFQYMTLFHLGEMKDRFGDIDAERIDALVRRVQPGGLVFFYKKSSAWDRVLPEYLGPAVESGLLSLASSYFDLLYYTRIYR